MSSSASNPSDDTLQLNWGFWDKQLETLNKLESGEYDVVVFRAGYGSGKTVLGARATLKFALKIPKSDNLILAPDAQKGGPSTYKGFFKQLPGENTVPDEGGDPENSPIVQEYHGTKRRLTLTNGSVIRLGSADVWNRYAGSEFNFIWGDEVAHYEYTNLYDLNRMLLSRQRTQQGPNVTLWTSTGNGYNQFYDFVERQETPDGEPLPTRIENVVADSRNNPFLPEKEKLIRQFEGTSKEEQGLEGGFAAAEGLVYSSFSRDRHVISEERADALTDKWRMYGYDAGWDDPRVVVEIARTDYGQYVVLDCFYQSESQPSDAIEWLEGRPQGLMYCEHEPGHIVKFRQAGWSANKAEKDLDEGIPAVRARLERDEDGKPGLLVSDACTEVIQEFMSYKEEHVGKSMAQDHALDALRYALFTHMPKSNTSSGSGVSYI
ncbi:Terminase-like family protein [Haladaptatus litoreus]|uniref:Terminase-like family protein n=1 Tax=Haladaptatus litoreus TaxID=553468 RepID=A0A1N7FJ23_9EURY|nr:terminase family protein [Haladaptatus litoreus]SIS00245.1 Terminase-like family protein [Haladaptatus litoreus]